jgi:hypothetical protein
MIMAPSTFAAAPYAQISAKAEVFSKPDFRSTSLGYIAAGTVVPVSLQKHVGVGGMGVFYKIRMPTGALGFVTDTDLVAGTDGKVKVVSAPALQAPKPPPTPPPQPQVAAQPPPVQPKPQATAQPAVQPPAPTPTQSIAVPTLWGATVAAVEYTEKVRGKEYSQNHIFVGPRRTSGANSPKGWRQEIGLLFTVGAPRFLSEAGAYGETSGYIVLAEYLFIKPFVSSKTFTLLAAAGPLLAYSSYKTQFTEGPVSESSFRPGLVLDIGASFQVLGDKFVRADAKILIEQTLYYAPTITLQFPF